MIELQLPEPLDAGRSEALLRFCLDRGADQFAVRCIGTKAELRLAEQAFFAPLKTFSLGKSPLELTAVYATESPATPGGRDLLVESWRLVAETIHIIRRATDGLLTRYPNRYSLEDWAVYREGKLFLGLVSHERYVIMRLRENEVTLFENLGIPHKASKQGNS